MRTTFGMLLLVPVLLACSQDPIARAPLAKGAASQTDVTSPVFDTAHVDVPADEVPSPTPDVANDIAPNCPGASGCACLANAECNNGLCIDAGDGANVCAESCSESCGPGQTCAQITAASGDLVSVCVARWARLCDPCASSKDCASLGVVGSACVDQGAAGHFCGTACMDASGCPTGYDCAAVPSIEGSLSKQCVRKPEGSLPAGTCSCSKLAVQQKMSTVCWLEAKDATGQVSGKCPGVRACGAGGLSTCLAAAPTAETCNGKDDDCNGQTDEGTCDDGNACTTDSCGGSAGCKHQPLDGAKCDADSSVCTDNDHCVTGLCQPGPAKNCDDANPCTMDVCDMATGCTHSVDDGIGCDDDNPCTIGDTCLGGACKSGKAKECTVDKPCTTAECDLATGKCKFDAAKDGLPCDDSSLCTDKDACLGGTCGGTVVGCDDGSPCTNDGCDGKTGCTHIANTAPCDDGNLCTAGDACQGGACTGMGKPATDCSDGNPCTDDACEPKAGCLHQPNAAACQDGNPCTEGDICAAGKCAGGASVCACQQDAGCQGQEDGNLCNGTLFCDKGKFPYTCQIDAKTVVECATNKDTFCLVSQCQPATGACKAMAVNEGKACDADGSLCTVGDACADGGCKSGGPAACDDKNPCTNDGCDPVAGCQHVANTAPCDADGDACTVGDVCQAKVCLPGPATQCDDGNPCTMDGCDKSSGKCTTTGTPMDGTACDADTSACTVGDACAGGKCVAGKALGCDDGNTCTDDGCDAKLGCSHAANTLPCDADGNACTSGDACNNKQCLAGKPVACDDKNPCTVDACDAKTGACTFTGPPLDGTSCDADGSVCTQGDACAGGKCAAGKALGCDDGIACTTDACDPIAGCTHKAVATVCDDLNVCTTDACDAVQGCIHAPATATCDDGTVCTKTDACQGGQCGGQPVTCDDGNACTADTCDKVKGCVFTNTTAACEDGDGCTVGDACSQGGCKPGAPKVCSGTDICQGGACVNKPLGAITQLSSIATGDWCGYGYPRRAALTSANGTHWIASAESRSCTGSSRLNMWSSSDLSTWQATKVYEQGASAGRTIAAPSLTEDGSGLLHVVLDARPGSGSYPPTEMVYVTGGAAGWTSYANVLNDKAIQASIGGGSPAYSYLSGEVAFAPTLGALQFMGGDYAWWATKYSAVASNAPLPYSAWATPAAIATVDTGTIDAYALDAPDEDFDASGGIQTWLDRKTCSIGGRELAGTTWGAAGVVRALAPAGCGDGVVDVLRRKTPGDLDIVALAKKPGETSSSVTWFRRTAGTWVRTETDKFGSVLHAFTDDLGRLGVVRWNAATSVLELYFLETKTTVPLVTTKRPVSFLDLQRHQPRFLTWIEADAAGSYLMVAPFGPEAVK